MILLPLPIYSPLDENNNPFNCVSIEHEIKTKTESGEQLSYMITDYPHYAEQCNFNFVYANFESDAIAFAANQATIYMYAKEIFTGSRSLDFEETEILNKAFQKSLKSIPTLPGRK